MPQPGCSRCPQTVRLTPEEVALLVKLLAQYYQGREQAGTAFVALQRDQEETM